MSDKNEKIEELLTRGVDKVVGEDELRERLVSGKELRIKLGIDPTSPHIHLGRATQLLKLRDFQELGHKIVFIIGDATGVIGDTSDKESERPMLSSEEIKSNAAKYFEQAALILDMERAEKHHNSEWLNKLNFSEIGSAANAFSVADFISRDNIKKRLDEGKRVSLRETLYPLMQGYDSVAIKADVEIGGSDQWFNLLAGRTLQEAYGEKPQHVLTSKLIHGLDGRKMSSSWGNTINLEDEPSDMFGKVMSLKDELMEEYFVTCTRVPLKEVESILKGDPLSAKKKLAESIVELFYGEDKAKKANENFAKTYSDGEMPDNTLEIDVASEVKISDVPFSKILIENKVVESKNEFYRLIKSGAIMNMTTGEKITDPNYLVPKMESQEYRIGKKRFIRTIVN